MTVVMESEEDAVSFPCGIRLCSNLLHRHSTFVVTPLADTLRCITPHGKFR